MRKRRILFVCGRARLRSPTAEQVFAVRRDWEVACAGVSSDADEPVTADLLAWADVVFVMEQTHRRKLRRRFRSALGTVRVICLDIPDIDGFMDPALVTRLEARVPRLVG